MKRTSMMMVMSVLVVAGLFLAGHPGAAFGREGGRHGHEDTNFSDGEGPIRNMLHDVDLTREQHRVIEDILARHRDELRAAFELVRQARQGLEQGVLAPQTNEAALRAAAGELGRLAGDAAILAARVTGEIMTVLTPAQRDGLSRNRRDRDTESRRPHREKDRQER